MTTMHEPVSIVDGVVLRQRGRRGIWSIDYRHGSEHRRKSTGTRNLKVAKTRAVDFVAALRRDEIHRGRQRVKLNDAVGQYLFAVGSSRGRSPRTVAQYRRKLAMLEIVCAEQKIARVDQLTGGLIELVRVRYAGQHQPKTQYTTVMVLKSFGNWLVDADLVRENPFRRVRNPKPRPRPKFVPSLEEMRALLRTARGTDRVQLATAAMTGMRVGEVRALRVQDVDLVGGWISVSSRADWSSKTGDSRRIPIHPDLLPHLVAYAAEMAPNRPNFFVGETNTRTNHTGQAMNPDRLLRRLQRIARKLGLPVKRNEAGIVVHSLRDLFETETVNARVPQFVVDRWMGHSGDHRAMGSTYFNLTPEASAEHMRSVKFHLAPSDLKPSRKEMHDQHPPHPRSACTRVCHHPDPTNAGQIRDNRGTESSLPGANR